MMKLKMYLRGLGIGMLVAAMVLGFGGNKKSMSDEEIIARAIQLGMVENRKLAETKQSESQDDVPSSGETSDALDPEAGSKDGSAVDEVGVDTSGTNETVNGSEESAAHESGSQANKSSTGSSETDETQESSQSPSGSRPDGDKNSQSSSQSNSAANESNGSAQSSAANKENQGASESKGVADDQSSTASKSEAAGEKVTITVKRGDNSLTVSKSLAAAGLISDAGDYDKYLCNEGFSKNISVGTYEILMGTSQEEIAKIITKKK